MTLKAHDKIEKISKVQITCICISWPNALRQRGESGLINIIANSAYQRRQTLS